MLADYVVSVLQNGALKWKKKLTESDLARWQAIIHQRAASCLRCSIGNFGKVWMASASPPAVQSCHEPTSLWLLPKIEDTSPWETLQKLCGDVQWGNPSNQIHQQRRRPDRNTRLAQKLDPCDKAQWRLHWRPVNVFCKINLFLKKKRTVFRTFEMTRVYIYRVFQKELYNFESV